MAPTIIFLAGMFAGAVGALSLRAIIRELVEPRAGLPVATARAIRNHDKANRAVLPPMPRDPRPWISPPRADFDSGETR